jgi:hypothetical protein
MLESLPALLGRGQWLSSAPVAVVRAQNCALAARDRKAPSIFVKLDSGRCGLFREQNDLSRVQRQVFHNVVHRVQRSIFAGYS